MELHVVLILGTLLTAYGVYGVAVKDFLKVTIIYGKFKETLYFSTYP